MSASAMVWALQAPVTTPQERLVLLLLADNVDCDGICTVPRKWLERTCCVHPVVLDGILDELEEEGFIKKLRGGGIALQCPEDDQ
jgi:DNA-binding IscR family transcriptional regulator